MFTVPVTVHNHTLQWLEHDFLDYLDEWEASAQAAENLSDAEKNKLCISRETLEGLRMTGLCTGFVT